MSSIIAHAPAKLNLYLGVEPNLQDNKHLLTSVFCTVSLADTLIFDFQSGPQPFTKPFTIELTVKTPPPLKPFKINDDNNSLLQTLKHFKRSYGSGVLPSGTLSIQLIKSIPTRAGLGGGSADAAAMLRMLCWLAQVDPLSAKSLEIARRVGADVSFFLHAPKQGSCALMGGAGDKLLEVLPQPALEVVLVKPKKGVSTRQAYLEFDSNPKPATDERPLLDALKGTACAGPGVIAATVAATTATATAATVAAALANNLEPAAIKLLSQIAHIKSELLQRPGVLNALVSGTGSTVFAICQDQEAALGAVEHFHAQGLWAVATHTSR